MWRDSLRGCGRSFVYAYRGLRFLMQSQFNTRIHLAFTVSVLATGFFFGISATEWCVLLLCITLVWTMEAVNTAIEQLTDLVSPEFHPIAGRVKDVSAGAVLVAAAGTAIVGLIVLVPHLIRWVQTFR